MCVCNCVCVCVCACVCVCNRKKDRESMCLGMYVCVSVYAHMLACGDKCVSTVDGYISGVSI